jgi:serine/threonine protein kinase
MLTEVEIRAAGLAVTQFGVDPVEVERITNMVLDGRARGESVTLFSLLEEEGLLGGQQVQDLRFGLDQTRIDPHASPPPGDIDLRKLKRLGDYRILRLLGEGGMGAVFLAFHEIEQKQVALKVLSSEMARQQSNLDRFLREAKSGSLLNHPNIVRNLASGKDRATSLHYIVLEYVDGETAQHLLEKQGRLKVGDAFHIILDIARALEYAHSRSIIHRDIKPGNILVAESGLAKLSDLGLAKRLDAASNLTHANQGFGTPYYMPYEQAVNAKMADVRSDIYALGATLYHLVTGEVPFGGENAMEIVEKKEVGFFPPASAVVADMPEAVDRILARMMARQPADRFQTASEVIVDLERSNLPAAVLSFVSSDKALQDPHIRQRLTAPAQPTLADLQLARSKNEPVVDHWFVRYRNDEDKWAKVKLPRKDIVERWRAKKFGADAGVSGSVGGPFLPLREVFSEIDSDAKAAARRRLPGLPARSDPRFWWIVGSAVAGALTATALVVSWFLMR